MNLRMYYGNEQQEITFPTGWRLLPQEVLKKEPNQKRSVEDLTREALENPIGAEQIKKRVKPGDKVTIVTDDGARHTPLEEMLPVLLEELESTGLETESINILIGLGTHGEMDRDALISKIGKDIVDRYQISQHDCKAEDLIPIGKLQTGAEVRINPLVANADVTIGLGTILPHIMNGFGGGPKIIFPAVSNYDAIREHHLTWITHRDSIFGNTENNPFYRDLSSAVAKAPLSYSLNSLFDLQDQVAAVLFGGWKRVHKEGAILSRKLCGIEFEQKSDVTLVSGYPYLESLQLMKPLTIGGLITKPGGTVIMTAKASSSFPPFFIQLLERANNEAQGGLKKFGIECFRDGKLLLEGAPIDLNCALFYALVGMNDYRCVLVSRDLDKPDVERIGFVVYETLEEALKEESNRIPEASVNFVPLGGALPILPGGIGIEL